MEFFDNTGWKNEAGSDKRSTKKSYRNNCKSSETHVKEFVSWLQRASQKKNLIDT